MNMVLPHQTTYPDILRIFCNSTSCYCLLALNHLRHTPCDICGARIRLGRFLYRDNEIRHHVCRDLIVCLYQRSKEAKEGVERRARHERRMRDVIDVCEQIALDFWEGGGGC